MILKEYGLVGVTFTHMTVYYFSLMTNNGVGKTKYIGFYKTKIIQAYNINNKYKRLW